MIGEMNCLINVQSVTVVQDDNGDIVSTPSVAWNKWADVQQDSGNFLISNGMTDFNESYRIKTWYEPTRETKAGYLITYNNKVMKVYNVRRDNEGNRTKEIITAFTSN
jgi:head-tail adaptor